MAYLKSKKKARFNSRQQQMKNSKKLRKNIRKNARKTMIGGEKNFCDGISQDPGTVIVQELNTGNKVGTHVDADPFASPSIDAEPFSSSGVAADPFSSYKESNVVIAAEPDSSSQEHNVVIAAEPNISSSQEHNVAVAAEPNISYQGHNVVIAAEPNISYQEPRVAVDAEPNISYQEPRVATDPLNIHTPVNPQTTTFIRRDYPKTNLYTNLKQNANLYKNTFLPIDPNLGTTGPLVPSRPQPVNVATTNTMKNNPNQNQISKKTKTAKDFENYKEIKHIWFTNWPDHGVPEEKDMDEFNNFIQSIKKDIETDKDKDGGTLIHCSAGVGRTGVVYVILYLLFHNRKYKQCETIQENDVDKDKKLRFIENEIYKAVKSAKKHRHPATVQTYEQYVFICKYFGIHKLIIDADLFKNIELDAAKEAPNDPTNKIDPNCLPYNRYGNILPSHRVVLPTLRNSNNEIIPCSDYINASEMEPFRNSYNEKFNVFAASCPKPATYKQFYRMLIEKKIKRIIMVTGLIENGREKCDEYITDEEGNPKFPVPVPTQNVLNTDLILDIKKLILKIKSNTDKKLLYNNTKKAKKDYDQELERVKKEEKTMKEAAEKAQKEAEKAQKEAAKAQKEATKAPKEKTAKEAAREAEKVEKEAAKKAEEKAKKEAAAIKEEKKREKVVEQTSNKKKIKHIWFTKWTVAGIPEDIEDFNTFIQYIKKDIETDPQGVGTLIHSSKGIGRTGIVYVILYLLFRGKTYKQGETIVSQEIQTSGNMNKKEKEKLNYFEDKILKVVDSAKRTRHPNTVETFGHYRFICNYFGIHAPKTTENEFVTITSLALENTTTRVDIKCRTHFYNRDPETLPLSKGIVSVYNNYSQSQRIPDECSKYINASEMDSFGKETEKRFNVFTASCPVHSTYFPSTPSDQKSVYQQFYRMLEQKKIKRIIMVTELNVIIDQNNYLKCDKYITNKKGEPYFPSPIDTASYPFVITDLILDISNPKNLSLTIAPAINPSQPL
jgi:protein tyrosine phosphatase